MRFSLVFGIILTVAYVRNGSANYSTTEDPDTDFILPRIVQGRNAVDGQYPYQVSLRRWGSHICGAVILTSKYVVTAAHCVVLRTDSSWSPVSPSGFSVRAGSTLRSSGGIIVAVSRIIPHPRYGNHLNDIGLLELSSPLRFSRTVTRIPIATTRPPNGASVVAIGWGHTSHNGRLSERLQYLIMRVVTEQVCRSRTGLPSDAILCLESSTTSGTCNGDSGGAAIYRNTLVGLTSFGIGTCANHHPDGFTMVFHHVDWLKRNSDL